MSGMLQKNSYQSVAPPWKVAQLLTVSLCCFLLLAGTALAAPTTLTINQPSGYTAATIINTTKPTANASLYTTVDNIELIATHLNQGLIYQAAMLDWMAATLETVSTSTGGGTETGLTIEQLNASFTAQQAYMQGQFDVINQKLDNMGGLAVSEGDLLIAGLIMGLIFAVTWKG